MSLRQRIAKVEQVRKPAQSLLVVVRTFGASPGTANGVTFVVVPGGNNRPIYRADHLSDDEFWDAVDAEHLAIYGTNIETEKWAKLRE